MKRGGNGRPLGRRVLGSRSSSKNGWTRASNYKQQIHDIHGYWLVILSDGCFIQDKNEIKCKNLYNSTTKPNSFPIPW